MVRSILIVSPDETLHEEVRGALDEYCCTIAEVVSRRAAIAGLSRQEVEMVIAELDPPDLECRELFAWVGARYPRIRRVAISRARVPEHAIAALEEGEIDDYIVRPWTHEELHDLVTEVRKPPRPARASNNVNASAS